MRQPPLSKCVGWLIISSEKPSPLRISRAVTSAWIRLRSRISWYTVCRRCSSLSEAPRRENRGFFWTVGFGLGLDGFFLGEEVLVDGVALQNHLENAVGALGDLPVI